MTSSKYLVSIVNDILDMNKLESGGVVEQEIPFNLAELLNRVNLGKQKQKRMWNILLTGNRVISAIWIWQGIQSMWRDC